MPILCVDPLDEVANQARRCQEEEPNYELEHQFHRTKAISIKRLARRTHKDESSRTEPPVSSGKGNVQAGRAHLTFVEPPCESGVVSQKSVNRPL